MIIRKKPVIVEGIFFTEEISSNIKLTEELAEWCGGVVCIEDSLPKKIVIPTLEGDHDADIGDCIIKGVLGEFYPCKPEAFNKTYDVVDFAQVNETKDYDALADAVRKSLKFLETIPDGWSGDVMTPVLNSDLRKIEKLAELADAVAWERECQILHDSRAAGFVETWEHYIAARAEVDRLLKP